MVSHGITRHHIISQGIKPYQCNDRRKDTESAKHNLFIPVEQRQQNFKMASYKLGHVTRKAGTRLVLHVTILVTSPFLSLIV